MSVLKYITEPLSRLFGTEKTIKKEALHEQIIRTNTALVTHVKPAILDTKQKLSKLMTTDVESKTILGILSAVGIKGDTVDEALGELNNEINGLITISNHMINMVSDYSPDYITNRTVSPKIAFVIHITNMLTSISLFTPDLLLYIIDKSFDMDGMPKIRRSNIEDNLVEYRVALNYLRRDMLKVINDAKEMPEITLDLLDATSMEDFDKSYIISSLPINGFVGNPIYHFRKWLVDRDVEKFEDISLKTTLLKSKLEQLKMAEDKEDNPKVARAIEYLEKEITANDKELRRLKS